MAEYPTSDRETGFADDLKALTTHGTGGSFDKFSIFLKVNLVNDVSFMQMDQIVNFASEQHGIWQTAYAFSPAHSPDVSAKNESKYWEELQKIWSALLVEQAQILPIC